MGIYGAADENEKKWTICVNYGLWNRTCEDTLCRGMKSGVTGKQYTEYLYWRQIFTIRFDLSDWNVFSGHREYINPTNLFTSELNSIKQDIQQSSMPFKISELIKYLMLYYTKNIQGCSLGLDVSVSRRSRDLLFQCLGLVSVKCGRVLVSVSSRTKNEMSRSRLGLGPEGLVYKRIFWTFFVKIY